MAIPAPATLPKINVYTAIGLCHASVCVEKDTAREEIESYMNTTHPTGIQSPWTISKEKFADGSPNPCPCVFAGRLHYLLVC